MKVYIGIQGNSIMDSVHTSLKGLCDELKVSYHSAVRGKRCWVGEKNGKVFVSWIKEAEVVKIKNRGRK